MRILVIGSGGREHALCWKLAQEAEVICAPGNPGIEEVAEVVDVPISDFDKIAELAKSRKVDFVLVGPEAPLVDGIGDRLTSEGIAVAGPDSGAAQIEGSKAFAKSLMRGADIPTAEYDTFQDPQEAVRYTAGRFDAGVQVVVKASGLAAGKGVTVCGSLEEAEAAIQRTMEDRAFGAAGQTVVIEDRLIGKEFSLLTLVSGEHFRSLPVAQDHKRALDGDQGPNTGGMGSVSPVDWLSDELIGRTEETVVAPLIREMAELEMPFRGVLFTGLMVVDDRPQALEFNVRFGDPEIQSVVRRIGPGLAAALHAVATGDPIPTVPTPDNAAVSVVLASGGYPGDYAKGLPIEIGPMPEGVVVFHAGTKRQGKDLVSSGGRVLAVSAEGGTLAEARAAAYRGLEQVKLERAHWRSDIGPEVPQK